MVTIHDYQTLFVLLGQITVCVDGTISSFLEGSRKIVYLRYRCFLVEGHKYRSNKKFYNFFDGSLELYSAPLKRDGYYVFDMVRKKNKDGKKRKRDKTPIDDAPFKNSPSFTSSCRIG